MAGKMNDEMRNELIDEVTEWMADEVEFSTEFLRTHGETWLVPYSLNDLYEDYYCGDLKDTITAFIDSGCSCNDWYEYFVDDNGDLHDWDDVGDVVSEMICDDSKYAEWCVEELEEGLITEPKELIDIFNKYAGADWQDVQDAYSAKELDVVRHYMDVTNEARMVGRPDMFINACKRVADMWRMTEYLDATHFCGISEDKYADICDHFNGKPEDDGVVDMDLNAVYAMLDGVQSMATNGISIEKATEMYVKKCWM